MTASEILSALGWPHVALIFALVFIFVFNRPLREFIGRIKSVGKDGLSTETAPTLQNEDVRQKAVDELMRLGDSPLMLEAEKLIRIDIEERGLNAESDSCKVLIRHLAATQIALDFEQIYNLIFGSQIFLLKKLNEVVGQGLEEEQIEKHYHAVQEIYPDSFGDWSFEQYLQFMFSRNLLTKQDGKIHITVKGVEFLVWMVKTGHSESRGL